MVKRTADQPSTTDVPALHGHYDGPRGHQDEHRHNGGGTDHPHAAGDKHLPRGASLKEYVPGSQLPDARRKMADATQPIVVGAAEARARVAALADGPADPASSDLAIRDGGGTADATVASFVHRLAHLAEHERFANLYSYEVKTLSSLAGLLADAETQLAKRELVDPKVIDQIGRLRDGWAMYRKVRDGGGS